jgi:hypothetical protein
MMTRPLSSVVSLTPGGTEGITVESFVISNCVGQKGYSEMRFGQLNLASGEWTYGVMHCPVIAFTVTIWGVDPIATAQRWVILPA